MRILAIDTSTEYGTCALWHQGDCLERVCPIGQSHSATLLPLVAQLLAEAACSVSQLEGIAFAAGPGAFTGLRMACAVAQGLAVGAGLPVLAVGTLDALALDSGATTCLAMLDARMGEIYTARFVLNAGIPIQDGEIRLLPPADLFLPTDLDCVLVGNALLAYPALAERGQAAGLRQIAQAMPHAAMIAALAAPRFAAGEGSDPALAAPLYVRDKVAQTVAERLAGGGRA